MPKVSIIIPNYNQTKFLREAIQSALNQTYKSFEVIVIDDGSTDNCREVVSDFGDKVRYIWQENKGLGGARNTGINAAQGELIGLLDADDLWKPIFLEKMVSLASQNPDAGVFYCSAQAIDEETNELPQIFGGPARPPEIMYWTLLRANFIIPSTVLMRRSIVLAAGLFEQILQSVHGCEDWDLWLRILPEHKFIGTSDCLVRYRIHGSSLSAHPERMQHAYQAVVEKHFGLDDGEWQSWSKEKRRAFGGVYRYFVLTSIQRQDDWQSAAHYLSKALLVDPTLAEDLGLFYDLALGTQPAGYRGSAYQVDINKNATKINSMLENEFYSPLPEELRELKLKTLGTANYALGLAAYNTGSRSLSRRFYFKALSYRHELFQEKQVLGNLLKSFISQPWLERIKGYGK